MRDMSGLYMNVQHQVQDAFVQMAVCEAFLNAVPIKRDDMTPDLRKRLGVYCMESLSDMGGGYAVLTKAMESCSKDSDAYRYLSLISSMAMEAATEIAERVVEEHKNDVDAKDFEEAAKQVTFTDEEIDKLQKGIEKVADDTLSEVIQTKVLDTIKEEKDAYRKDAELEQEIKDAIKEVDPEDGSGKVGAQKNEPKSVDENDTGNTGIEKADPGLSEDGSLESSKSPEEQAAAESAMFDAYMRSVYGRGYRAKHASVFSTIHEMALEAVTYTTEQYEDIPTKAMSLVTRHNTFPCFESFSNPGFLTALETVTRLDGMESIATPDHPVDETDRQQTALMTAAVIYAFFETLNTMHLYCPGLTEVKKFVDEHISLEALAEDDKVRFCSELQTVINNAIHSVNKATAVPDVEIVQKNMEAVREACVRSHALETELPGITQKVNDLCALCKDKISKIRASQNQVPAMETEMEVMRRTQDTLKFSRMASSYGMKPNVAAIRCKIDPSGTALSKRHIAMECLGFNGAVVNHATVALESAIAADRMPDYVEAAIRGSKLKDLGKPISLVDRRNGKTYAEI